jgi:hypothetical protein
MAEDTLAIELAAGRGDPVRVEWDLPALAGVASERSGGRPFTIPGGLDAKRWELARVVSGALVDGRLLAIAALRPRGAGGHGDEAIGGALVRDGGAAMLDDVLLSVEYGPDGAPRRLGLELYEQPESLPVRIAGDRSGGAGPDDVRFELRANEVEGVAFLTVLRPG